MLLTTIFVILFSNALVIRKDLAIFYSRTAIIALLSTAVICYNNLHITFLAKGIGLYGGLFNLSSLTQSFNLFILLMSATILLYNSFFHIIAMSNKVGSLNKIFSRLPNYNLLNLGNSKLTKYKILEYPLVILFIICGAVFLMSSADLISLFISIELQSYGLYILSTLHRDSEQATWGGLTYFLLGGLSSCFILLGSSLLYINSGTTSLDGLYIITSITDVISKVTDFSNTLDAYYINFSLIIISVGFLFKLSAAPFHFWSPDVYDAIPTHVTTYVAIIAKVSIFIFLLELVYYTNKDIYSYSWKNTLLLSSLLSLIIGSVLGLTQYRIKRVYAYSTISHVGFILLALTVNTVESIQAYIFYIISYSLSNLNAFMILVAIGYTMYFQVDNDIIQRLKDHTSKLNINEISIPKDILKEYFERLDKENHENKKISLARDNLEKMKKVRLITQDLENDKWLSYPESFKKLDDLYNSPIQLINQLKGYFYTNSYLSLSLCITLFSFMGIPPLIGFFAKQMVLSAALDNGYVFITLVGIITSVIGAAYYLNIVKNMFFFKSDYEVNPFMAKFNYFGRFLISSHKNTLHYEIFNKNHITLSSALTLVISILTLLLLLFIFIPNECFNLAKILTLLIFN